MNVATASSITLFCSDDIPASILDCLHIPDVDDLSAAMLQVLCPFFVAFVCCCDYHSFTCEDFLSCEELIRVSRARFGAVHAEDVVLDASNSPTRSLAAENTCANGRSCVASTCDPNARPLDRRHVDVRFALD